MDNSTAFRQGMVCSLLNYVPHNKHKPPKTALDLNSKPCIASLFFGLGGWWWWGVSSSFRKIIIDGLFLELSCIHIKVKWGNEVFTFIFVQSRIFDNVSLDLGFRKC